MTILKHNLEMNLSALLARLPGGGELRGLVKEYHNLSAEKELTNEEFDLLFKLTAEMFLIPEQYRFMKDAILTSIKNRQAMMTSPPPEIINFVCLGKVKDIQLDYIRQWVKANPNFQVNLWYDNNALLCQQLFFSIEQKACAALSSHINSPETVCDAFLVNKIIEIQNAAYNDITLHMSEGRTFDNSVKEYMVVHCGIDQNKIKNIISEHQSTFNAAEQYIQRGLTKKINFQLREINYKSLFEDHFDIHRCYFQELILRQNLAGAVNIIRLLVLKKEGGFYIDAGILPPITDGKKWAENFLSLSSPETTGAIISAIVSDELRKSGELPARKNRENKYIDVRGIVESYPDKNKLEDIRTAVKKSIANGSLFSSLSGVMISKKTEMECYLSTGMHERNPVLNNNILAAQTSSPLITKTLDRIVRMYEFISTYNIDGLKPQQHFPAMLTQAMKDRLVKDESLPVITADGRGSHQIIRYRFDNISTAQMNATESLSGRDMFLMASRSFFKPIFSLEHSSQTFLWIKENLGLGLDNATIDTEEEILSSSIGPSMMEYRDVYAISTRFNLQIILQLDSDPLSQQVALFFHNKCATVTQWVQYDSRKDALIYPHGNRDLKFEGRTRIIIVGQGKLHEAVMGDLSAGKVAALITLINPRKARITHLSLIGCNMSGSLIGNDGMLPDGFISSLLSHMDMAVSEINLQEALVTVDVMGRKWVGELTEQTGQIGWSQKEGLKKCIIKKFHQEYLYRKIPLEDYLLEKYTLIPPFDTNRFGISNRLIGANYLPQYLRQAAFENRNDKAEKLAKDALKKMLNQLVAASKEGEILMTADSVALLMALSSENSYEMVIVDNDLDRLHTLQRALKLSVTISVNNNLIEGTEALSPVPTYEEWIRNLMLSDEHLSLFYQLVPMMGYSNSEKAFEQLQKRVKENKFSFYHLDLTAPDIVNTIQSGQLGSPGFTGYYLGRLELYYGAISDSSIINLNIIKEKLTQLTANLKKLKYINPIKEDMTEYRINPVVYHYSEVLENSAYSPHRIDDLSFIEIYAGEQYVKNITARQPQVNVSADAAILAKDMTRVLHDMLEIDDLMVPVLGGLTFEVDKIAWKVPFINPQHPERAPIMVETRSDVFIRMYEFLNSQVPAVSSILSLNQRVRVNTNPVEGVYGLNAALVIQSLLLWIHQPSEQYTLRQLSVSNAVKIHFYITLAMQGQALLSDTLQAVALAANVLEQQKMFMRGSFGVFERNFAKLLSGIHGAGMVLNVAALGLDIYQLVNASTQDDRSRAAFQLGLDASLFGVMSASMITGLVGMETLSASLSTLGAPLTGVSIGGLALYSATEEVQQKAKYCGNVLNALCDGLRNGYQINADFGGKRCLVPPVLTAIDNIVLSNQSRIAFSSQRYQRYESVAGAFLSWMFFGKRPVKGDDAYHEFREALQYPATLPLPDNSIDTIIVPTTPKGKFDFAYGVEVFANSSHADYNTDKYSEYRCARLLENKDSGFLFTYHTVLDHAMHSILPVYDETSINITISSGNKTLIFPWITSVPENIATERASNEASCHLLEDKYSCLNYTVLAASSSVQTLILPGYISLNLTLGHFNNI